MQRSLPPTCASALHTTGTPRSQRTKKRLTRANGQGNGVCLVGFTWKCWLLPQRLTSPHSHHAHQRTCTQRRTKMGLTLAHGCVHICPQPGNSDANVTFDYHSMPKVTFAFAFPGLRAVDAPTMYVPPCLGSGPQPGTRIVHVLAHSVNRGHSASSHRHCALDPQGFPEPRLVCDSGLELSWEPGAWGLEGAEHRKSRVNSVCNEI